MFDLFTSGLSFTGFLMILNGPDTWVRKWIGNSTQMMIYLRGLTFDTSGRWGLLASLIKKETIHQCSSGSKHLQIFDIWHPLSYHFLLVFSRSHRCRKYQNKSPNLCCCWLTNVWAMLAVSRSSWFSRWGSVHLPWILLFWWSWMKDKQRWRRWSPGSTTKEWNGTQWSRKIHFRGGPASNTCLL